LEIKVSMSSRASSTLASWQQRSVRPLGHLYPSFLETEVSSS
jgi:hypothetical protein